MIESESHLPQFVAYNPSLQAFLFTLEFWVPESDVGGQCTLLLGLDGQVRDLSASNTFGGGDTDCTPQPAPNGQALLTCYKLLRPGKAPLSLLKPKADLALACFANDSTLLTVYAYGEWHYEYDPDSSLKSMAFLEPTHMKHEPNAFLTTVRGTELARFRYDGAQNILGFQVPRAYVPACHTYYLLDEPRRSLRLIDKHNPAATREIKFKHMRRFVPPQHGGEVRFRIQSETSHFEFYADPVHPERLRYQQLTPANKANSASSASTPPQLLPYRKDNLPPQPPVCMNPTQLSEELRHGQSADLTRRRWIVGLSLLGVVAGQIVTLYQTGIIPTLPDPPVGPFDSPKVNASDYAYKRLDTPDAALMIGTYGVTTGLAAAGGLNRATDNPLLPVTMGTKLLLDVATNLKLGKEEWDENKALCAYCQAATVISIASLALALPEVAKGVKNLFGGKKSLV